MFVTTKYTLCGVKNAGGFFMKLDIFKQEVLNKDNYTILVSIIKLDNYNCVIAMFCDIRYVFVLEKIENFYKGEIKQQIENNIKNSLFKNKTKVFYMMEKEYKKLLDIEENSLNVDKKEKDINSRNIRSIKNLYEKKNIDLCNLKNEFNNKPIRTLAYKSPAFWFQILNDVNLSNEDNDIKVIKTIENFTPEVLHPTNVDLKYNSIDEFKLDNTEFDQINKDNLYFHVKTKYENNWFDFFFNLKTEFINSLNNIKEVHNSLKIMNFKLQQSNECIIETNKQLKQSNESLEKIRIRLEEDNKKLHENLIFLKEEIELQKNIRLKKEERLEKLKNAKKHPKRDYIEYNEFKHLLNLFNNESIFDNRKKCAFLLLYTTGLRVSNLLKFKVTHIKSLIHSGYTRIDLIKKGEVEHLVTLSFKSKQLLTDNYKSFNLLFKYKNDDDFFFTSFSDTKKAIHRSNFNKELNDILKEVSKTFNKNIKTHSFRTSYITDLLQIAPLHLVRDIIGHKVVASTEIYYRSSLTQKTSLNLLNKADIYRFK